MKKSVVFWIFFVTLPLLANEPQVNKQQKYQELKQGVQSEIQQRHQEQKTVQEKALKKEQTKKKQYPRGSIATH